MQKGVDVVFSNRDSIMNRVTRKTPNPTNSGVYVLPCDKEDCEKVYVGQSANIPLRVRQHAQAISSSSSSYTSARHSELEGHELNTATDLVLYRSNCLTHRLIVESSLISLCNTIRGNKPSAAAKDMNILAPMIVKGAPINWKILSKVQASSLNPMIVPRRYRSSFSPSARETVPEVSSINLSLNASVELRSYQVDQSQDQSPSAISPSPNDMERVRSRQVTTSGPQSSYNLRSLGGIDLYNG